jgi:hypothetical protein
MLPPPYQLEPSLGSYYSNATGLFRGDVRYYNLSSTPYDTNVTWKPVAGRVMENANLSAIPERLGTWNWSAVDGVVIRVHDRMVIVVNVSESVAIFQVLCLLFCHPYLISTVASRESSSCPTRRPQKPCFWNLMGYTSRRTDLSTRLLKRKGMSRDATPRCDFLTCSQFLLYRHAVHPERRSY